MNRLVYEDGSYPKEKFEKFPSPTEVNWVVYDGSYLIKQGDVASFPSPREVDRFLYVL